MSRPVSGCTANWMFEPPVSTPISRMIASAAWRMIWYSLSVSVCAGATVIESPVCTPIGSKFSIEQMMTTLSFLSRITSSSNSFHPAMDSSISTSLIGEASRPMRIRWSNSSRVTAMFWPVPPSVRDGRMMTGRPISAITFSASATSWAMPLLGRSRPIFSIAALKRSRSSALRIAATSAPISSTPYLSSTPRRASSSAMLSAVCPPTVGRIASGCSAAMMRSSTSGTIGSMYVRSANSGSVMIVAGFEFTRITR